MTLADLILFARDGSEGGAVQVLEEAKHVVGVEDQVAGLGHGPLRGAHATNGESDSQEVVAKGDRVTSHTAQEVDDHLASDAKLGLLWTSDDAGQTLGEAVVAHVAGDRGRELGVAVTGDDGVDDAIEHRVGSA